MTQTQGDEKLRALSARIDNNHEALKAKLDELYVAREAASGERWHELEEQIRHLKGQEIRLLKSKNAAWMAHWLRTDGEVEVVERPHRKLGLALIVASALALVLLGLYVYSINQ